MRDAIPWSGCSATNNEGATSQEIDARAARLDAVNSEAEFSEVGQELMPHGPQGAHLREALPIPILERAEREGQPKGQTGAKRRWSTHLPKDDARDNRPKPDCRLRGASRRRFPLNEGAPCNSVFCRGASPFAIGAPEVIVYRIVHSQRGTFKSELVGSV
ncbi:hypothetical protein [Gaiella sp.]|uniref:hypothetical protein n=1 Tax=Gaiella sp. TaxID=2663207 RepID=UPI003263131F